MTIGPKAAERDAECVHLPVIGRAFRELPSGCRISRRARCRIDRTRSQTGTGVGIGPQRGQTRSDLDAIVATATSRPAESRRQWCANVPVSWTDKCRRRSTGLCNRAIDGYEPREQ